MTADSDALARVDLDSSETTPTSVTDAAVWAEFEPIFRLDPCESEDPTQTISWSDIPFVTQYPILDWGAGSGFILLDLLAARPELELLALEPDRTQRAILTARVAAHSLARQRVTLLTGDEYLGEPASLGGALLINTLHLRADKERLGLLGIIGEALHIGAPLLVSDAGSNYAGASVPELISQSHVGLQSYERWFSWKKVDNLRVVCVNEFRVLHKGVVVRTELSRATRHAVNRHELVAALEAIGVDFVSEGGGVLQFTKTSSPQGSSRNQRQRKLLKPPVEEGTRRHAPTAVAPADR